MKMPVAAVASRSGTAAPAAIMVLSVHSVAPSPGASATIVESPLRSLQTR